MKKTIIIFIQIFLILFTCSFAFAAKEKPNVILISIDTLRPDRLGCYGYNEKTSPNIDEFSKDAVLFKTAVSPIPMTTPGHASMLSGLYPQNTKVVLNTAEYTLEKKLLAELLKDNGYMTAGIVGTSLLDKRTKINRGFVKYNDQANFEPIDTVDNKKLAEDSVDEALTILKKRKKDKPFFLFLHFYDVHWPFDPPKKYIDEKYHVVSEKLRQFNIMLHRESRGFLRRKLVDLLDPSFEYETQLEAKDHELISKLYDGELRYVDEQLGRLFSYLKKEKIYDDTVIVLTSDHGEMLGEKLDYYGHAPFLFDETIMVPMLMKLPGIKPKKIDSIVRLIDIHPTILDYVGIEDKEERDGISLLPVVNGNEDAAPKYSFLETFSNSIIVLRRFGYRDNEWKYFKGESDDKYLYNLNLDMKENVNVIDENYKKENEFDKIMAPYEKILENDLNPYILDPDRVKEMKSLGYL